MSQQTLNKPQKSVSVRSIQATTAAPLSAKVTRSPTLPVPSETMAAACCALCQVGFSRTPIHKLEHYLESVHCWTRSLSAFLKRQDLQYFFPDDSITMQKIHRLAVLHNKSVRPPKRFISGACEVHVKRRTPHTFRAALSQYQDLVVRLAPHQSWIDVKSVPYTAHTLAIINQVLDDRLFVRQFMARREALQWLTQYLNPDNRISAQRANGNLEAFRDIVEQIVAFNTHIHYSTSLGPGFLGIRTNWNELHSFIEYSQSISDVIQNPAISAKVVANWQTHGHRLYALSREASIVSRRMQKLSKLVNRAYHSINDPRQLLSNAERMIFRLNLWIKAVTAYTEQSGAAKTIGLNQQELTPRALLKWHRKNASAAIARAANETLNDDFTVLIEPTVAGLKPG